ncbi:ferritin-like domain-containing protein [Amycolatopsis sp. NPDC051045]|uniref:ferritin-like domain-containing protein n=1 Tax=Amycolatopsis sp. NPDC051045 TaxID=3156922 RepID=UPI003425EDF7
MPPYPHPLPHGDRSVHVHLAPFGPEALELFLRIEQPASADDPPQGDEYRTIGQFYAAIEAVRNRPPSAAPSPNPDVRAALPTIVPTCRIGSTFPGEGAKIPGRALLRRAIRRRIR